MFQDINPLDKSTAILEIFIMLIVAFIIGFIIAWILRKPKYATTGIEEHTAESERLKLDNERLQRELAACKSAKEVAPKITTGTAAVVSESDEENARKLGFKMVEANRKDDLTRISGIGPFIEKKLNALGIYTFEQISEFTPDTVQKVTDAIEFFPGRIARDGWVRQAKALR